MGLGETIDELRRELQKKLLGETASEEVAVARLSTCSACDKLYRATWQCKKCGCFVKVKVKFADQTCPIGNW